MSPALKTPKSGSELEQPHVANHGALPVGSAGSGRAGMDPPAMAAKDCHVHKRPLPSPAPWVVLVLVFLSVLSPPGWLPAPGPLASSCVCVLRAPPPTLCSVSKCPSPCGDVTRCAHCTIGAAHACIVWAGVSTCPFSLAKRRASARAEQHTADPLQLPHECPTSGAMLGVVHLNSALRQ